MLNIDFIEETHQYFYRGEEFTSVTKLIKDQLTPPFPAEEVAKKIARKRGVGKDEVFAEREEARQKGVWVHEQIARTTGCGADCQRRSPRRHGKIVPEYAAFERWLGDRFLYNFAELIPEWVVGDERWKLAGTVDLYIRGVASQIVVFETGSFRMSNKFEKMREPFESWDNCEYLQASLRTSILDAIVRRSYPYTETMLPAIVHLGSDGSYEEYHSVDLSTRVEDWLDGIR